MAIDDETRTEIWRLHSVDGLPAGSIARMLGLHHGTVRRAIKARGQRPGTKTRKRVSKLDPFTGLIATTLTKYPRVRASRIYQIAVQHGYTGSEVNLRRKVATMRVPKSSEAFLRLHMLPGQQLQCDWAEFGKISFGSAQRRLFCFVMTLSHSRMTFIRFYPGAAMDNFLRGHVAAFEAFGGVPREVLYDNLKSAVISRFGKAIELNRTAMAMAAHYGVDIKAANVRRGNEKGRVERTIRYVRDNFFAARQWHDLDHLNAQADHWCQNVAAIRRCPGDREKRTVRQVFEAEKAHLRQLPDAPFPVEDIRPVRVGKTPWIRYDCNDYSVPHQLVGRTLSVAASLEHLRILDADREVARHRRSFDKGARIENPKHTDALLAHKRAARRSHIQSRLIHAVPNSERLLVEAVGRGYSLAALLADLLRLLDSYGADELAIGVAQALERGSPHPNTVRSCLTARRKDRGEAPPVALDLADNVRVQLRPGDLGAYDRIATRRDSDSGSGKS